MAKVPLRDVAQARSGDKGSSSDITLFAPNPDLYKLFLEQVTAEKVKQHFSGIVEGEVYRYEVPNVLALKFLCKEALGGNAASTLRLDNLGKCFGGNLLRLEVEVPDDLLS
jgi:hypothetical protein